MQSGPWAYAAASMGRMQVQVHCGTVKQGWVSTRSKTGASMGRMQVQVHCGTVEARMGQYQKQNWGQYGQDASTSTLWHS